jgi:hypothetical protein
VTGLNSGSYARFGLGCGVVWTITEFFDTGIGPDYCKARFKRLRLIAVSAGEQSVKSISLAAECSVEI